MPGAVETITQRLDKLIRKFEADKSHYLSKGYPEAQARVDFITPFFKALAWDVENEAGLAHHDREVIVERGESDTTGQPANSEISNLVSELDRVTDEGRKIIEGGL